MNFLILEEEVRGTFVGKGIQITDRQREGERMSAKLGWGSSPSKSAIMTVYLVFQVSDVRI